MGQILPYPLLCGQPLYASEVCHGVIRCKGRINNASLPVTARNPILLPSNHKLVCLIIQQSHCSVKHNGIKDTLINLRERFWIIQGRKSVKKFIQRCIICRKIEGAPYNGVLFDDLPSKEYQRICQLLMLGLISQDLYTFKMSYPRAKKH